MAHNPYRDKIVELVTNEPNQHTYQDVATQFDINSEAVRNIARNNRAIFNLFIKNSGRGKNVILGTERSFTGETLMREATQADLNALREHCEIHGLPYDARRLWWHKTPQFSVSFYDKQQVEAEQAAQEQFLARLQKAAPKTKKSPVPTKTLAIPANFDVHIGKHCELIRTGRDYTPDIAVSRVLTGMQEQLRDFKHFDVSDVLLPLGNDIVHVDNNANTSTSGTPQDAYGSVESQMMLASEMYIRIIEEYAKKCNVWLLHVHSNHDRVNGWSVSRYVAAYFRNHPRVHAHPDSMNQVWRKYFVFGNSLIVFHHGEAKEEKLLGAIKQEAGEALAVTKRIYCYQGHTHHKTVSKRGMNTEVNLEKDHSGLTTIKSGGKAENLLHVETVRSPSEPDDWHGRNIFLNMPAVETFIHDDNSQKYRLTYHF